MSREPFTTEDYKGYRIALMYDEDAESPREWDNLGTMVCWHRRYNLGDKHAYADPQEFLEAFGAAGEEPREVDGGEEAIMLPLYLYDHSGISMSTGRGYPYNDPWDAGQVGWIYVTKQQVGEEYGRWDAETIEAATKLLEGEVEVYDRYIRGMFCGFRIEATTPEDLLKDADLDIVGREELITEVWGYDCEESALDEARSIIDHLTATETARKE